MLDILVNDGNNVHAALRCMKTQSSLCWVMKCNVIQDSSKSQLIFSFSCDTNVNEWKSTDNLIMQSPSFQHWSLVWKMIIRDVKYVWFAATTKTKGLKHAKTTGMCLLRYEYSTCVHRSLSLPSRCCSCCGCCGCWATRVGWWGNGWPTRL